ncbi:MAG: KOW domain-containing RNA-binding protein [Clostridia bacterium]
MTQQLNMGDIVVSIAGHDISKCAIVISVVNEQYVLIADGKLRTIEKPKLKKVKHLRKIVDAAKVYDDIEKAELANGDIAKRINQATKNI